MTEKLYDWNAWAVKKYGSLEKARQIRSDAGKMQPKKLTDEQVAEIRADTQHTLKQLGETYGVSHFYISRIRNNRTRV